jgi:hypothetical protein
MNEETKECSRLCDFCGRPAVTRQYRTLYEGTECEQTSSYFLCARCADTPNDKLGLLDD